MRVSGDSPAGNTLTQRGFISQNMCICDILERVAMNRKTKFCPKKDKSHNFNNRVRLKYVPLVSFLQVKKYLYVINLTVVDTNQIYNLMVSEDF